jgi:hypothetical protein
MARKSRKQPELEELLERLEAEPPGDFRLPPTAEGRAFRFTLYLPLLSGDGKEVFTEPQSLSLGYLFGKRFGGYSTSALKGEPPWQGAWLPEGQLKPIIDRHMLFVVYSAQTAGAELFFQYLKVILQLPHIAQQQVIVVELLPVLLLTTPQPQALPESLRNLLAGN